mgnify:FL=1
MVKTLIYAFMPNENNKEAETKEPIGPKKGLPINMDVDQETTLNRKTLNTSTIEEEKPKK